MDSFLRSKISNQYNLFHGQKIKLSQLKKISEEQEIPPEDLMRLFDVSYVSRKKFENKIEANAYIRVYSIDELKEIEQRIVQEISYFPQMNQERMEMIEQKYRITSLVLKRILKMDNSTYYQKIKKGQVIEIKFKDKKTAIKLDKTLKTNEKIKKIQIDLKYIKTYGNRFYSKQELDLMSYNYQIDVYELLLYLAHNKILYKVYEDAYNNNLKGVWLGKSCRLSNEFIEKNYKTFDNYMDKIANRICEPYNNYLSKDTIDDIKSEVWEDMIKTAGVFEKNIIDEEKLISYLKIPLLFKMKTCYSKMPKYERLYYINRDGLEYERQDILTENRYTPGIEEWSSEIFSYIKEVEDIHVKIMRDIKYNLDFVLDYPKNFYNRLSHKYQLSKELLDELMGEIRTLIEKNQLIKYDKNGYALPMFYVEEKDERVQNERIS